MQVKKNQRLIHVSKHMVFLLLFCIHLFQLILVVCFTHRVYPPILHLQNHLLRFLDNLSDVEENWINTNAYKIFYSKKKKKKSRDFCWIIFMQLFWLLFADWSVWHSRRHICQTGFHVEKKYNSEIVLLRICSQIFPCTIW